MMASAEVRTFGFWFATRTVKFIKGEVWHVHTMLFWALPTHHKSAPGTIIDNPESAVTAFSKAAVVTAKAKRKCSIFLLSGDVYAIAKEGDKGNKERQVGLLDPG